MPVSCSQISVPIPRYSEKEDPAEIIDLLNDYFALMFDAITGHYGMVNQMLGDGLMAIFGAPIYRENSP